MPMTKQYQSNPEGLLRDRGARGQPRRVVRFDKLGEKRAVVWREEVKGVQTRKEVQEEHYPTHLVIRNDQEA